ncbi:pseudouridine synthase, partial [Candidatus Microgenomates bacterium]|nr:pseudouridine synthase [Candidatus Microgenomates bacterium]
KEQAKFMAMEKEYIAEVAFGMATDTGDREGRLIAKLSYGQMVKLRRKEIENVSSRFIGKVKQSVPLYSAVKIKGKKLYELARKGKAPKKLPERIVEIKSIKALDFKKGSDRIYPVVKLKVVCGKGVYIRQLAVDLGRALGFPSHLRSLVRTRVGKFSLDQSLSIENLTNLEKEI